MLRKFLPAKTLVTFLSIFFVTFCYSQEYTDTTAQKDSLLQHDTLHLIESSFPKSDPVNISSKPSIKCLVIPVSLIAIGAVSDYDGDDFINKYEFEELREEHFAHFHTKIDNYLQFAPIAAVYTLDALGIKGTHNVVDQTILLAKSELLMSVMIYPIKHFTDEKRPDGSASNSFPSGHTAQAFLSAEFLRREYGKDHPWIAVAGYLSAASVGAMRMLNNRHWINDVIAGAGFGILSVDIAYLTSRNKWPLSNKNIAIMPYYSGYSEGICLSYHFK